MKRNFLEKIKERLQHRQARTAALTGALYWFLTLVYLELLLHIVTSGAPDGRFALVLGFSAVFACVPALITSSLPKKAHFPIAVFLTALLTVLYGSQLVYYFVFGTLYSVALMQQGGQAITSFWKETLLTMWNHLPWLLMLLVPLIVLIVLRKFRCGAFVPSNGVWRGILLAAAVVIQILSVSCLQIGGTGYFTNYYIYYSDSATTDQAVERFGLLTAFRLDILNPGQTEKETEAEEPYYIPPETTAPTAQENEVPQETVAEPVVEYNILDIDFDALNAMTDDEKIQAINNYCASLTGTNKNEYTGMLSGYNLIVLCAEAFATGAIDAELTPTLYRLANEGIIFNNYYNTYPNNTTDGEYTLCMGIYPDTSRWKGAPSFYASRSSYLPYCLGNVFSQQLGIQSYGYHNYQGSYYGRDESHPNMGYSMKFAGSGMEFTSSWPASDLEMMRQSVDDYISADQQFHAYYMTFSGHLSYDLNYNAMAVRNWNKVSHLSYSDPAKCYLSCNIELDKALEYLMQRLEEAGIADRTAIVLAGDHYPYGLTEAQYSELVGYTVDKFTKYKSTLIFWVGGLEENIVVDEYCCNVDILPTILNLWGFRYDSRMLAGTDVFSDGTHVAVLTDKSFFTDKVWLDANSGQVRYLVDESQVPQDYVENMLRLIETKLSLSTDILNTAYYNFVFGQGDATVDRYGWGLQEETEEEEPEPVPEETEAVGAQTPPAETETTHETTLPPEKTEAVQETTVPPAQTETTPAETSAA